MVGQGRTTWPLKGSKSNKIKAKPLHEATLDALTKLGFSTLTGTGVGHPAAHLNTYKYRVSWYPVNNTRVKRLMNEIRSWISHTYNLNIWTTSSTCIKCIDCNVQNDLGSYILYPCTKRSQVHVISRYETTSGPLHSKWPWVHLYKTISGPILIYRPTLGLMDPCAKDHRSSLSHYKTTSGPTFSYSWWCAFNHGRICIHTQNDLWSYQFFIQNDLWSIYQLCKTDFNPIYIFVKYTERP